MLAVLAMDGARLAFEFGPARPDDPGWVEARVRLEELRPPGFVLSGTVGLTESDIDGLVGLVDELVGVTERPHVPARRRWETYEASIEFEIEWRGDSGEATGRFEPLHAGETSAEADFVAAFDRTSLLAFRDALRASLRA